MKAHNKKKKVKKSLISLPEKLIQMKLWKWHKKDGVLSESKIQPQAPSLKSDQDFHQMS